jgi:hypothetical protein
MNFNKELFEKAEAKEFGEFESLTLGGHEVVIMDAREYESEFSGKVSLKVCVDIAGNDEQAGYFKRQYEANKESNDKWSTSATRYLSLNDENLSFLKGFITALENSNTGFKFDTKGNWEQLKGKKIVGVFGLEEYKDNEGKIKVATKLTQFRSLDKLKETKIPKVKLLNGDYIEYEKYQKPAEETSDNEVIITGDDLPF